MTQRSLGKGGGIIAAKSYFMLVKWLKPVNRNIIASAMRPATFQEESRSTPSSPTPRRRRDEIIRTNRDTMCVSFPGRASDSPSAYAAPFDGSLTSCCASARLSRSRARPLWPRVPPSPCFASSCAVGVCFVLVFLFLFLVLLFRLLFC